MPDFVEYVDTQELTNQFTLTYGPKGSGKSTFGLTMNPGRPLLMLDLDRRSYSARRTAIQGWGARIVEIPGLEVNPSDKRTLLEILGKKQIRVKGGNDGYNVWALNKPQATDIRKRIEDGIAKAAASSDIASVFIDDAKVLGAIWAASYSEDGRISSIPQMQWGEVYGPLKGTMQLLTRTAGCDKDVILAHHTKEERKKDPRTGKDERTGRWVPNWIDRLVELADNVVEHYINDEDFTLGVKFTGKIPADNAGFYGLRIEGLQNLQYDLIKMQLLGLLPLPE